MGGWKPPAGVSLSRLATGIEAGIVGGVAMLGLLITGSLLRGHVWWEVPNLLGSTFYGSRAFRSSSNIATLSGLALHFTITGTLGAAFGTVCGGIQRRRSLLLAGIFAGLFWHFFAQAAFWPRVNPLVILYGSAPVLLLAHIVFGACLGFMGSQNQAVEADLPADGVE
jgi:hypothetical protein